MRSAWRRRACALANGCSGAPSSHSQANAMPPAKRPKYAAVRTTARRLSSLRRRERDAPAPACLRTARPGSDDPRHDAAAPAGYLRRLRRTDQPATAAISAISAPRPTSSSVGISVRNSARWRQPMRHPRRKGGALRWMRSWRLLEQQAHAAYTVRRWTATSMRCLPVGGRRGRRRTADANAGQPVLARTAGVGLVAPSAGAAAASPAPAAAAPARRAIPSPGARARSRRR